MTRRFGGTGGGGYNYVQDATPSDPSEGEEWYDTGVNAAYVYDGASWIELTVVDHSQLSGVTASDHHTRYSDSEASAAAPVQSVNGATGAVSVPTSMKFGRDTHGSADYTYNILGDTPTYVRVTSQSADFGDVRIDFNYTDATTKTIGSGSSASVGFQDMALHAAPAGEQIESIGVRDVGRTVNDSEIRYMTPI